MDFEAFNKDWSLSGDESWDIGIGRRSVIPPPAVAVSSLIPEVSQPGDVASSSAVVPSSSETVVLAPGDKTFATVPPPSEIIAPPPASAASPSRDVPSPSETAVLPPSGIVAPPPASVSPSSTVVTSTSPDRADAASSAQAIADLRSCSFPSPSMSSTLYLLIDESLFCRGTTGGHIAFSADVSSSRIAKPRDSRRAACGMGVNSWVTLCLLFCLLLS